MSNLQPITVTLVDNTIQEISTLSPCTSTFAGSYGNNVLIDGTFDQDYAGGAVVHEDSSAISLFGNAWKAYRLCDTIEITKSTFLEFEFKVFEEAEGHAICLEEGELLVILPLPL